MLLGAEATPGRLLASTDGGDTWQERSPIDLLTLAAHPEDTDLLIGTTGDGLQHSGDAGQTWQPTSGTERRGQRGRWAVQDLEVIDVDPAAAVVTEGEATRHTDPLTDQVLNQLVREQFDPMLLDVLDPVVSRLVVGLHGSFRDHQGSVVRVLLGNELRKRNVLHRASRASEHPDPDDRDDQR